MIRVVLAGLLAAGGIQEPPLLLAGFAEVELAPEPGTLKGGSNGEARGESTLDPVCARAAVFESGAERFGLVALDTALVNAELTAWIRERAERDHGFPGARLMVAATHNHSGPLVPMDGAPRGEAWLQRIVERAARAVGEAYAARKEASIGHARGVEFAISFNRRVIMRDGTVRTHGSFKDPKALALEGPVDPEVGVLAARGKDGKLLGALVNFACHPTHHWNDPLFSADYPGALARALKEKGVPVTVFLQGASGNISHGDPRALAPQPTKEEMGAALDRVVEAAIKKMAFMVKPRLAAASRVVSLPFRRPGPEEIKGKARGAQRFEDPGHYDSRIPGMLKAIEAKGGVERAEIQLFRLGDVVLASLPGEFFAELGLRLKEGAHPDRAWVVGYANAYIGYIPHKEAFARGGYETTFGPPSFMAPETGDLAVDAALELIRETR